MQLDKKAQVSVEFMAYIGVILLFVSIVLVVIYNMQRADESRKTIELLHYVGNQFSDYIYLAIISGNGFSANFSIPRKILGKPYFVHIYNDSNNLSNLVIDCNNYSSVYSLRTGNITNGTSTVFNISVSKGYLYIQNINGQIEVN